MSARPEWLYDFESHGSKPNRTGMLLVFGIAIFLGLLIIASPVGGHDCAVIADSGARLACFDGATHARPAKGGETPDFNWRKS